MHSQRNVIAVLLVVIALLVGALLLTVLWAQTGPAPQHSAVATMTVTPAEPSPTPSPAPPTPTPGPTPTPSAYCAKEDVDRYFDMFDPIRIDNMELTARYLRRADATLVADFNRIIARMKAIWTPPCCVAFRDLYIEAVRLQIEATFCKLKGDTRTATSYLSRANDAFEGAAVEMQQIGRQVK